MYSGVDRRFFALVPEEAPYLLYFGRMDIHTKGIDLLIAAFAAIAAECIRIFASSWPGVALRSNSLRCATWRGGRDWRGGWR